MLAKLQHFHPEGHHADLARLCPCPAFDIAQHSRCRSLREDHFAQRQIDPKPHVAGGPTQHFFTRVTKGFEKAVVHIKEPAVLRIGARHRRWVVTEHPRETFLALPSGFLRPGMARDVLHRSHDPRELARWHELGTFMDGTLRAIRPHDAIRDII